MIYEKRMLFYMKIYNNIKEKPQEEISALLEQLSPEARSKVANMLVKFYKKKSS